MRIVETILTITIFCMQAKEFRALGTDGGLMNWKSWKM